MCKLLCVQADVKNKYRCIYYTNYDKLMAEITLL